MGAAAGFFEAGDLITSGIGSDASAPAAPPHKDIAAITKHKRDVLPIIVTLLPCY